jgi:fermentation-respiration switch protein FrsA (DUF1100 family)
VPISRECRFPHSARVRSTGRTKDLALLPEYAQQVYDAALGPKELVWIETHNHIELYDQDPYVSQACDRIVTWLGSYL